MGVDLSEIVMGACEASSLDKTGGRNGGGGRGPGRRALSFPWSQLAGLRRGGRTLPTPGPTGFTTEKQAAVGPGRAAEIQLRKEGVKEMHALKAKVRANWRSEGGRSNGHLLPWALSNALRTRHLPTGHPQGTLAVEGPQSHLI